MLRLKKWKKIKIKIVESLNRLEFAFCVRLLYFDKPFRPVNLSGNRSSLVHVPK